ncbi:hypothetical protein B6S59_25310 [Pseudomonas sp. A46]|nr:hypothetical protein [Pseudomonas sp. A46]OWJ91093.1 hypothetical protein B6S59_25310 [Pseudomonas sp. A46]
MATPDHLLLDAAMRSAYVALARRLALDVGLDLQGLANDLEQLGDTHPDPLWQNQHQSLADVLRTVSLRVPANDD